MRRIAHVAADVRRARASLAARVPRDHLRLSSNASSVLDRYDDLISSSQLRMDPQQRTLAQRLTVLQTELEQHARVSKAYADSIKVWRADVRTIEAAHEEAARQAMEEWSARPLW